MARKSSLKINCPYCKKSISLDEALTHQLEDQIGDKLSKKHQQDIKKIEQNAKKNAESSMSY